MAIGNLIFFWQDPADGAHRLRGAGGGGRLPEALLRPHREQLVLQRPSARGSSNCVTRAQFAS